MSFRDYQSFGISRSVFDLSEQALLIAGPAFAQVARIREANQLRVISAMQKAGIAESDFGGTTGYGYDDRGREKIEQAFAAVMGSEAALVRMQISSGTQILAACLFALLRPGDELLAVTGNPYDTLNSVIGKSSPEQADEGSLRDFGISYGQVELLEDGSPDLQAIGSRISGKTRVVFVQKSRGYSQRRALVCEDIAAICRQVRACSAKAVVLVDNCYGEFTETAEPCMAGADLCAGSLIKNPGGGICPSGGYAAGRQDLVAKVAARINAPGLGSHVGPSLGFNRLIAQGLYLAPGVVAESLKGAVFAAAFLDLAGFRTSPAALARRGDIIQSVILDCREKVIAFCQSVQAASPVDSFVRPEPWPMPGYENDVIMAAGTFIQGASIELSADGPLRPPWPAYLQGGLCFENVRLAMMLAVEKMGAVSS